MELQPSDLQYVKFLMRRDKLPLALALNKEFPDAEIYAVIVRDNLTSEYRVVGAAFAQCQLQNLCDMYPRSEVDPEVVSDSVIARLPVQTLVRGFMPDGGRIAYTEHDLHTIFSSLGAVMQYSLGRPYELSGKHIMALQDATDELMLQHHLLDLHPSGLISVIMESVEDTNQFFTYGAFFSMERAEHAAAHADVLAQEQALLANSTRPNLNLVPGRHYVAQGTVEDIVNGDFFRAQLERPYADVDSQDVSSVFLSLRLKIMSQAKKTRLPS